MAGRILRILHAARYRVLLVLVLVALSSLGLTGLWAWVGMVSGLLLAIWLPGWWMLSRVPDQWQLSSLTRFFLATPLSLLVTTMASYLFSVPPVFSLPKAVLLTASVALLAALSARPHHLPFSNLRLSTPVLLTWLVGLLPFLLFLLRGAFNPYLSDMDGHGYVQLLQQVVTFQEDNSFLFPRRAAFTHLVANLHFVTLIDFESLFKWVLPGAFWLSTGALTVTVFERLQRGKLFALFLLASPAFLAAADRFKPETTVWLAAVPAVLFGAIAAERKSWTAYAVGFFLALTTLRLHDTGFMLVLAYVFLGVTLAWLDWSSLKKRLTKRTVALLVVVLLPYLLLFDIFGWVTFLRGGLSQFVGDVSWNPQWWFLDSYRSAGAELGWPGWRFLLYYVYNGALVFFVVLTAGVFLAFRKGWLSVRAAWLPGIAFLIYAVVAELLPRFGVFILPDRAMVHAFFYGALSLSFIVTSLSDGKRRWWQTRWVTIILAGWLLGSVAGATYLAAADGGLVSRSETGVIRAIRSLPPDAVVTSTQVFNEILVETYGKRQFLPINPEALAGDDTLSDQILHAFSTVQERPLTLFETVNTELIERTTVISATGWVLQRSQVTVSSESTQRPVQQDPTVTSPARPLYALYSFAKTDGLLAQLGRTYWTAGTDTEHRQVFLTLDGPEVVYQDDAAVLVKLR